MTDTRTGVEHRDASASNKHGNAKSYFAYLKITMFAVHILKSTKKVKKVIHHKKVVRRVLSLDPQTVKHFYCRCFLEQLHSSLLKHSFGDG